MSLTEWPRVHNREENGVKEFLYPEIISKFEF